MTFRVAVPNHTVFPNHTAVLDLLCDSACRCCERPSAGAFCETCRWELGRPPRELRHRGTLLAGAWSLGDYAGVVGKLVRRAKFHDDDEAKHAVVSAFIDSIHRAVPSVQAVVPVGTTPWRRLARGMHLPDEFAAGIGDRRNIPVVNALRRRWSAAQSQLARGERSRHAEAAFSARGAAPDAVLLVDDVLTTGSTAHAAAAELLGIGAQRVYLAVMCSSGHPRQVSVGIS